MKDMLGRELASGDFITAARKDGKLIVMLITGLTRGRVVGPAIACRKETYPLPKGEIREIELPSGGTAHVCEATKYVLERSGEFSPFQQKSVYSREQICRLDIVPEEVRTLLEFAS